MGSFRIKLSFFWGNRESLFRFSNLWLYQSNPSLFFLLKGHQEKQIASCGARPLILEVRTVFHPLGLLKQGEEITETRVQSKCPKKKKCPKMLPVLMNLDIGIQISTLISQHTWYQDVYAVPALKPFNLLDLGTFLLFTVRGKGRLLRLRVRIKKTKISLL